LTHIISPDVVAVTVAVEAGGLADSAAAPFTVLELAAVMPEVVVTAAPAVVVAEVTVAVVELVVEAAAADVGGVEDAGRELWPVDGRLKIFTYIYRTQFFTIILCIRFEVLTELKMFILVCLLVKPYEPTCRL
jgi:hypothetical protein